MAVLFLSLFVILFSYYRLLRFLHVLQQDAYIPRRYIQWLIRHRAVDLRCSASLLLFFFFGNSLLAALSVAFFLCFEPDPRKRAKLALVMTPRAKELHRVALLFAVPTALFSFWGPLGALIAIQLLPLQVLFAVTLLSPREKKKQQKFKQEASAKMEAIAPYTIGITGSYGKTSTKDLLGKVLRLALGATYWPPRGTNTDMGIARSIREEMSPWTQYAVIEMAAYGKGSIARLCRFTPPDAAILTAIGTAHLERFGSRERIRETKAELVEALKPGSILVCNGDDTQIRIVAAAHPDLTIFFYGTKGDDLACRIGEWQIVAEKNSLKMRFSLTWQGKSFAGETPQLGRTALLNIAAAFTMACALGADPELAITCFAHCDAVDNRLKAETYNDVTYLHDAYNSNPTGFAAALEVLEKVTAKRRVLMTPGMIELGEEHAEAHRPIAEQAKKVCDQVVLVGPNADELKRQLRDLDFPQEKILHVPTRDEALACLQEQQREGDAVLIENDLPDLYEEKIQL